MRGNVGRGAAIVVAAAIGTTGAVVLVRLSASQAETQPERGAATSMPSTKAPSGAERDNRYVLTHRESVGLVAWAKQLRACVRNRGLEVGEPVAYPKQIDLSLRSDRGLDELSPTVTACGDSLGMPPLRSSLQFRRGKLVLYLPKQCLLDPKVTEDRRAEHDA